MVFINSWVGWRVAGFLGVAIFGHLAGRGCGNFIFYARALRWHFKGFLITTLTQ